MDDTAAGPPPDRPHPPTAADLRARRREILEAAARHRARRLSVVPSPLDDELVAAERAGGEPEGREHLGRETEAERVERERTSAQPGQAVALLAGFTPDASVLDHIALARALEKLFGVPVPVVAEGSLAARRLAPGEVEAL